MDTPLNEPIESAADLHRAIAKRGLEPRPTLGRDAALIAELARKLGTPPTRFISNLEASGKSAEDYLRALMQVAEPFARMFREIWIYLAKHCAPKASESLLIRFGFDGDNREINWDEFRVLAQTVKKVRSFGPVLLWPFDSLFQLGLMLVPNLPNRSYPKYSPGQAFTLRRFDVIQPSDKVGDRAREAIQSLIDEIQAALPGIDLYGADDEDDWPDPEAQSSRNLPELIESNLAGEMKSSRKRSIRELAFRLTDIVPLWGDICEQWDEIPESDKRKADDYFLREIEPLLKSEQAPAWRRIREALDLLDLPFWRYRWHTYEVWASVKALEALADFNPQLVVRDGHVLLDAASPALVARLAGTQLVFARVQGETKLAEPFGNRKAIKPDLRFSLDDPASNAGTIAIVEYKQRSNLDAKHALEVLGAYSRGVQAGGKVVLINYDSIPNITPPPGCIVLGDVQPRCPDQVVAYQNAVQNCFERAGVAPLARRSCILLDVSGSMESEYAREAAQRGLRRLVNLQGVKVFRFNDGLVEGGDLQAGSRIVTGGGTQLGATLEQLFSLRDAGIPDRLLIVTDGEHDHPDELLKKSGAYRECTPEDLENQLGWLTGGVDSPAD